MQIIDLKRSSRLKSRGIIDREYGGRIKLKDAINSGGVGIGKLLYQGGLPQIDHIKEENKYYKSNIEFYQNGVGLYIYNVEDNYLVLLDKDEIKEIIISKPLEVIKPANFSFFKKMIDIGFDYYKCRFMLLEHEMIEYHPVSLTIHLHDQSAFTAEIKKISPYRHVAFFKSNIFNIPFKEELQGYLTLD